MLKSSALLFARRKRVVSTFKLLRSSGYTLRIVPGTPEENAPVFDPELEQILRPAA